MSRAVSTPAPTESSVALLAGAAYVGAGFAADVLATSRTAYDVPTSTAVATATPRSLFGMTGSFEGAAPLSGAAPSIEGSARVRRADVREARPVVGVRRNAVRANSAVGVTPSEWEPPRDDVELGVDHVVR